MEEKFFVELREFLLNNENCSSGEMEEILNLVNTFELSEVK